MNRATEVASPLSTFGQRTDEPPRTDPPGNPPELDGVGRLLLFVAVIGSVSATAYSQAKETSGQWPSFWLWMVGVFALAAGAVRAATRSPRVRGRLALSRLDVLGVLVITAVAFFLRFVRLADVPYPVSGDEAAVGLEGWKILDGTKSDMFRTGWSSQPNLSFLGPALSMELFGRTVLGLRLFPTLMGAMTVLTLFLLTRWMFSRPVALLAAGLLACMPFHIHFSRIAVNNADAVLLLSLTACFAYATAETLDPSAFIATGMVVGLNLYSFAGARLVVVFALLILLFLLLTDHRFRRAGRALFLSAVAAGVMALPTAVFFLQRPDIGFGRLNQMGIFQTGWLSQEIARSGHSAVSILGRQLRDPFLMFVAAPASHGFYNSPGPLLDIGWSIVFVLGMAVSWVRFRDRRGVLLNLWFWSVVFFGGTLIIPPPAAERVVLAAPAVAAFAALGIWTVAEGLGKILHRPLLARFGATLAFCWLAFTGIDFYFREYTPRYYFADANSEVGTELGRYLARTARDGYVYFSGLPRMWYRSIPSTEFLSRGVQGEDFESGTVPEITGKKRPVLFVVLPHLRADLERIKRLYPGGTSVVVRRRPRPEEPLFLTYRLD